MRKRHREYELSIEVIVWIFICSLWLFDKHGMAIGTIIGWYAPRLFSYLERKF